MVDYVQSLVEKLELSWRILRLCGGDMSFTSALTFDFEVFSAAQQRWLEVSSVSNFENYQDNRLKCRYRDENKKIQLCHTLNGSASLPLYHLPCLPFYINKINSFLQMTDCNCFIRINNLLQHCFSANVR